MLNTAMIIGNLTRDVEFRYTQSGIAVASFSVATSEKYKDKSGKTVETTEYHSITVWDKLADLCSQYLQKGSKVFVQGKLKTDKYTDQNGVDKYTTKIIAHEVQFLTPKSQQNKDSGYEPAPQSDTNVPF